MIYVVSATLLLIGGIGLLITLLMGGHGIRHGGHHAFRHHSFRHNASGSKHGSGGFKFFDLLSVISPLVFFSFCFGAGASGLITSHFHFSNVVTLLVAIAGGLLFYGFGVRPLISLVFNFASAPSKALEGAVAQPAEVISRFDASGKGLVKLTIDGQFVRVLATLEDVDRQSASEIKPGDQLVVTTVDTHTNACRVARI